MSVKKRLIATLLLSNENVVQTRKFKITNMVGNAYTAVDFFNTWSIDEIIILDITRNKNIISDKFLKIISELSSRCFVPLSVGGKIKNLNDARSYTNSGADKIVINSSAVHDTDLIHQIKNSYGSQCCIVSIDVKKINKEYYVVINNGSNIQNILLNNWLPIVEKSGAGEIFINNIDFDGNKNGYDLDLLKIVKKNVNIPVIAMGGVGNWMHFEDAIKKTNVDAVAAGNIFHYSEQSTSNAKKY